MIREPIVKWLHVDGLGYLCTVVMPNGGVGNVFYSYQQLGVHRSP